MAEEKQFDATQSRLDRARREGDAPRSTDLSSTVAFACAALGVVLVAPLLCGLIRSLLILAASTERISSAPYGMLAGLALLPLCCGLTGGLLTTFLQMRGLHFRALKLSFEKLNPLDGFKRMFSRDAVLSVLKAALTAMLMVCAVLPAVRGVFIAHGTALALVPVVLRALGAMVGTLTVLGLAFGIFDLLIEQRKWKRRLRMSFDEIKREHKQNEGDPQLRSRRKQAHRTLLRGSITRLREAAFVVTNPTHIAIALEYRPPEVEVPRVLIRAVDEGAQLVKRRARELGVPLVENVALARLLLASTENGASIPRDTYEVTARIVAVLLREGRLRIPT
jgi:flagellar biosynthesis protein FlhB